MSTTPDAKSPGPFSRRRFLGSVGLGATGVAMASSIELGRVGVARSAAAESGTETPGDRFGRMFHLPPFAEPTAQVKEALLEMGRPGGLLDAKDDLGLGPVTLIVRPDLSPNNRDNPDHTAGTTFLGQFMDHDMTFDTSSRLGTPTAPESSPNARTPALDLDSVYGAGPIASPQLYEAADTVKLKVESGGLFEDLPRLATNQAVLGDPRNDEHVIISGLHTAFLLFHNRAVDLVRGQGLADPVEVFAAARRLTTWHYQWLILHEFLPLFVGQPLVADILARGRRFYTAKTGKAFMPVEFQGAAYRFGHSLVRPSYRANLQGQDGGPFFGFIFDPAQEGKLDPDDLRGGCRAARRFVGWQTFFDFGDGEVRPNKRIDTKISTPLFHLPLGAIASHDPPTALPQRTLLRHLTWMLPSGQRIAREIGAVPLSPGDLDELSGFGLGLERSTPLFYYVLEEAELTADGLHLGAVDGRIVAEVIIGLLQSDPASFLSQEPGWRPTLPTRAGGTGADFRMVDFLTFAGVDPVSRGQ